MVKHNTTLINSILLLRLLHRVRDGLYGTEQDSDVSYFSDGIIVDIYVRRSKYVEVWHRVSDQADLSSRVENYWLDLLILSIRIKITKYKFILFRRRNGSFYLDKKIH